MQIPIVIWVHIFSFFCTGRLLIEITNQYFKGLCCDDYVVNSKLLDVSINNISLLWILPLPLRDWKMIMLNALRQILSSCPL